METLPMRARQNEVNASRLATSEAPRYVGLGLQQPLNLADARIPPLMALRPKGDVGSGLQSIWPTVRPGRLPSLMVASFLGSGRFSEGRASTPACDDDFRRNQNSNRVGASVPVSLDPDCRSGAALLITNAAGVKSARRRSEAQIASSSAKSDASQTGGALTGKVRHHRVPQEVKGMSTDPAATLSCFVTWEPIRNLVPLPECLARPVTLALNNQVCGRNHDDAG